MTTRVVAVKKDAAFKERVRHIEDVVAVRDHLSYTGKIS
jgi:hypothetical protein